MNYIESGIEIGQKLKFVSCSFWHKYLPQYGHRVGANIVTKAFQGASIKSINKKYKKLLFLHIKKR